MKKEEAEKRLVAIESEVAGLRKIIRDSEPTKEITDRIKTFEDACKELGIGDFTVSSSDTKDEIAYKRLKIIIRALNEGWVPDWSNENQYKYYLYFKMGGSSFGFSGTTYVYWCTNSPVGSRLCFSSEKLAKYAGSQFESIYKDFLTI